jgi:hypothetical protein
VIRLKFKHIKSVPGILLASVLLQACSSATSDSASGSNTSFSCQSTSIAKGSRQFGMDILDVPSIGNYTDSLNHLKEMGGEFQTFHVNWSSIEGTGSGASSGAFTDPSGGLAALNSLANTEGVKVTLRIHPVDVPGKFVPSDLSST